MSTFYDEIGGLPTIERIVGAFYEGVANDPLLRPMYEEADLLDGSAAQRLSLFLAQYWGGPGTYSELRGHPRLRLRHAPFPVTAQASEHWLAHFRAGLDQAALDAEHDAEFWRYVQHAAQFLINTPG